MFQSKAHINRRHSKKCADRAQYLNQLAQEYKATENQEAKQQVLANFANFAYDPINYDYLWDIKAVDLYLEAITSQDPLLQEFGMGGLANICLDPRHHPYIMSKPNSSENIIKCVDVSCSVNLQINAMTTLMQLVTVGNYTAILTAELEDRLKKIKSNQQQKNVSTMVLVFLTDFYNHSY